MYLSYKHIRIVQMNNVSYITKIKLNNVCQLLYSNTLTLNYWTPKLTHYVWWKSRHNNMAILSRFMQFQQPYFILYKITLFTVWYCFRQNIVRLGRFSCVFSSTCIQYFSIMILLSNCLNRLTDVLVSLSISCMVQYK